VILPFRRRRFGSGERDIITPMPYPASYFRLSMFRQCRHRYKLHYVDDLGHGDR